jgi:hypothetical protein
MFLYFIPHLTYAEVRPQHVRDAGLGEIFADLITTQAAFQSGLQIRNVIGGGPGNLSGVILAPADPSGATVALIGFFPDCQHWTDCGRYWLGRSDVGALPGPEDLRRAVVFPGYDVTLGDGQVWTVPIVRKSGRYAALPRSLGLNDAGEFVQEVLPEFAAAWQASKTMFDHLFQGTLPWPEAFDLAVGALALNYRLGRREASLLKLLTTQNYLSVFEAVCDWPKVTELLGDLGPGSPQKKTPPPTTAAPPPAPSTSPGPRENFPRMHRPEETCISTPAGWEKMSP